MFGQQHAVACLLLVLILYTYYVIGNSEVLFERKAFAHTGNDVIENKIERSVTQCARRCYDHSTCVAMKYEEDSTCVTLKSVTEAAQLMTWHQYVRVSCLAGWSRFGDSCYYVTPSVYTRASCRDVCVGHGGHLVTDTSSDESTYIKSIASQQQVSIWIGGKVWYSTQGEWDTGETWDYTNWALGQPTMNVYFSHYLEMYIYYSPGSEWISGWGSEQHHCMCEKELIL